MSDGRRKGLAAAALAVLVVAAAPFAGIVPVSYSDVIAPAESSRGALVFWELRLPRILLGFLVGAALSMSGVVFQAIFRNPLASPFTLGVSSGAAFGAGAGLMIGVSGEFLGLSANAYFALAGALLTVAAVDALGRIRQEVNGSALLLAGVVVNFFFGSLVIFIQYLSDISKLLSLTRWMMGDLQVVGLKPVAQFLPFFIFGSWAIRRHAAELNLLALGDEFAQTKGVEVRQVERRLFLAVSLMIGMAVTLCGPIGFVGVMVPHIARACIGVEHRGVLLFSFLLGGAGLVACDTLGRTIAAPIEVPVGVITALIGGPFFIFLLLQRR